MIRADRSRNKFMYEAPDLQKFGLVLPPMRFNAKAFPGMTADRAVNAAAGLLGLKSYDRKGLIAQVEATHGVFDSTMDLERLAFWRALISNSSIDSYFTRMARNSLNYYAADAADPTVGFQNSHRHNELPVGRSVTGQLIET